MSAENIINRYAAATEAAEYGLYLNRLATKLRCRLTITYPPRHKFLEMVRQHIPHFTGRAKTIFRLILHRPHQNAFYLRRNPRRDLSRPRIFGEIKDQQRIVLGVRSREQMKHCRAETIKI